MLPMMVRLSLTTLKFAGILLASILTFDIKEVNFRNYLKSGFILDDLACLPYDAVNTFSSNSYTEIFNILKVSLVILIYFHSYFVGNEAF